MTLKSIRLFAAISVSAGSFFMFNQPASAARDPGIDLLVVPVKFTPLQVAFDAIKQRDLILVGYEGDATTEDPVLHVWNGQEWISISDDQFESSTYLTMAPERIVLIGDDDSLPPALVEAAKSNRSAKVLQIPHLDTASMLGSLGKVYDFNSREWGWFAARYKLELSDRNSELRKISYYDQPIAGRAGWPPWKKSEITEEPSSQTASINVDAERIETESLPPESSPGPAVIVTETGSKADTAPSLSTQPIDWEEKAVADDAPVE